MKREDIKLRRAAREGDGQAMLALARRYLTGSGMPRNVSTGLQYLLPQRTTAEAALLVCQSLSLDELIEHDQVDLLAMHAGTDAGLRIKFGVWQLLEGDVEQGFQALHELVPGTAGLGQFWAASAHPQRLAATLDHLSKVGAIDGRAVALAAAKRAGLASDLERLSAMLRVAVDLQTAAPLTREWIYRAVTMSLAQGRALRHLESRDVHAALEFAVLRSEPQAWFILGLALCGLPCGANSPATLVTRENLRKGCALLVRAADAGYGEAWLYLHQLNSNPRCSVANPEMARFCLEKAAAAGHAEAQRRLGALILSKSRTLIEMEHAVTWIHMAARQHDPHAWNLLRSLLLPVEGDADEAAAVIAEIGKIDPWLSARLRLAREFGLTKQEAMSMDPISGERPWGLVTAAIPYLSQSKLSAPRVVPAVTEAAAAAMRHAVAVFSRGSYPDFDSPQRPNSQRRRVAQFGLDETLFFAAADSTGRDRVRIGTRWAHHERTLLREALSVIPASAQSGLQAHQ